MRLVTRLRAPKDRDDGSGPMGDESDPVSVRLDAALAEYRDATYATWTAPEGGATDVSALGDRRIVAALHAAPAPAAIPETAAPPHRFRRRIAAGGAAAALVGVILGVGVATQDDAEPGEDVLLAAATPGGDRGPFADGAALQRCLDAARIPVRQRLVLGAGPVQLRGSAATVLLLPGDALGDVRLLAVTPACANGAASSVLVTRTLRAQPRPAAAATLGHRP